ncbi:hypothetical protein ABID29_000776 [Streptococcus rupicaprae]|uniref:Uncharacterized protein n=1 Tax=Streptococcus rupicaprae TaxID=759619 RepID=A0ABV2FGG5_9STRE
MRKTIDQYSEGIASDFPNKPQEDTLEAALVHTGQLMAVIEKYDELLALPVISQTFNYLKEAVEDDLEYF